MATWGRGCDSLTFWMEETPPEAESGEERGFVTGSPMNSEIRGTGGRK
ncbi:hypothetical protein Goshw_015332 [Gossypium schwendimanii]|uniref:Uncharacterized protein n=1 Tax=Gossypium schwendimanii TaxID=34291 RepID=A0A7J9MI58_GOSSC|nr:hypothetical protein [Gossypium schwendimanii]